MTTSGTPTPRTKWQWAQGLFYFALFAAACYFAGTYCWKAHATFEALRHLIAADGQQFTEAIKTGIEHTSDASQSLAQTLLLIAAALWGIIIGKDDERKVIFGTYLTVLMAVGSNVLLGLFLYSYYLLDTIIAQILYKSAAVKGQVYIVNLTTMRLADLFSYQLVIFIATAVAIGSTLLCAHTLKRN